MKNRVSPAAIGIFITGAIVLLFASLIIFGGGQFFRATKDLRLTFKETVTGLDKGAPVKLMGATIGNVKEVGIDLDAKDAHTLFVSVVIEIDRKAADELVRNYSLNLDDREAFDRIINELGLRAKLETLSMLSGQLYVALEIAPDEPGFVVSQADAGGIWQVPTLPSTKKELFESVMTTLKNLTEFDFKGSSEELKGLLADLRKTINELELARMSHNASDTLASAKKLLEDPKIHEALVKLNTTLDGLNAASKQFGEAGANLKSQTRADSTLSRELVRTLEEASAALSAVRQLAEELQRNPNAILTGKQPPAAPTK